MQRLLDECASAPRYEQDTSWIAPLLIEKLHSGEPEPMRRAQDELALLGDEAQVELRRFVERHFSDAFAATSLENAMGAAGKSEAPAARAVLLVGLDHPHEVVRLAALAGLLAGHLLPSDFDALSTLLEAPRQARERQELLRALFRADGPRAAESAVGWMLAGERKELWPLATSLLLELEGGLRTDLCERLAERLDTFASDVRPALAAACARAGLPQGTRALRALGADPDPHVRLSTARSAARAGLVDELGPLLGDADPRVRAAAVDGLAQGAPALDLAGQAACREALRAALDDEAAEVRTAALERLAALGDAGALDRGLAEIEASGERMLASLRALRAALSTSPALAERALEALAERDRREAHRPLAEREATLKALGLVPLAAAAEGLRRIALEHDGETLQGLRAHQWILIQAGNTGVPGRTFLAAELERETDPARRLDLIDAVGSVRDELARATLLALVDEHQAGHEALFAAARLVQHGPAQLVATRVKRAALGVTDGDVRRGLWCLLWRWY